MSMRDIRKRTRYFIAAEGESEQSFVKWLQELSEKENLHIHMDCQPLGGGGYRGMLNTAVRYRERGLNKGEYKDSYLLVDSDRSETGDWDISQLRNEAEKQNIKVCCQNPNIEGVFCRMFLGRENTPVRAEVAQRQLQTLWPEYNKPVDARTLSRKFSLEDLLRVANFDADLDELLRAVGLKVNGSS